MGNRRRPKNPLAAIKGRVQVDKKGMANLVVMPSDEKEVIKTVPAKVNGETVGECDILDDGTVDIRLYENVSDDARKQIMEVMGITNGRMPYRLVGDLGGQEG